MGGAVVRPDPLASRRAFALALEDLEFEIPRALDQWLK
jgi:hypothetical protein